MKNQFVQRIYDTSLDIIGDIHGEINALQNKYKSAFNFNYYYNVVLLLIVIGIAGYNAYNIFFRKTELFYCIVSVLYIIASCWVMSILVYNCRIKGTFK